MDLSIIDLASQAIAANVGKLEEAMLKEEQVDCPVQHHFYPGIYMREVHIKAGTFSIGHYQKTRHLNLFLKGSVNFIHEDGRSEILKAPMIFMSDPGRKVGFILEDMVWLNAYATDETEVHKLEETYLDKSNVWYKAQPNIDTTEDQEDFKTMLNEYGLTAEQVRQESERTEDLIPFPEGPISVAVMESPIEGKGLFTMANINEGDLIAPGRVNGKRTPAGRYINHSKNPTAVLIETPEGVNFVAKRDLQGNKGGYLGDEITIDYRTAIELSRRNI